MEPQQQTDPNKLDDIEAARSQQRVLRSEELLRGEQEVLLLHRGELYRLRETRNGKLILGK